MESRARTLSPKEEAAAFEALRAGDPAAREKIIRTDHGKIRFYPLYIHRFRLVAPRKLQEVQQLAYQYHTYECVTTVSDRLRWLHHSPGLMQKDVAAQAGILFSRYRDMETGACNHYPVAVMDKLAGVLQ